MYKTMPSAGQTAYHTTSYTGQWRYTCTYIRTAHIKIYTYKGTTMKLYGHSWRGQNGKVVHSYLFSIHITQKLSVHVFWQLSAVFFSQSAAATILTESTYLWLVWEALSVSAHHLHTVNTCLSQGWSGRGVRGHYFCDVSYVSLHCCLIRAVNDLPARTEHLHKYVVIFQTTVYFSHTMEDWYSH